MTTGRPEIDFPSPRCSLWSQQPRAPRASLPLRRKKRRKNRGGDITPMRLRRSLFFVAPATPADRPSRRKPGETVPALPGRPGRAGCGLPGAPKLPTRGAFVLSKRAAQDTWALPADDLRPRRIEGASWSQIRCRDGRSVRRGCERDAQPETAARTAVPAAQSIASLLTSAHYCPELPGSLKPPPSHRFPARHFPAPFYCLPALDCAVLAGIGRLKCCP